MLNISFRLCIMPECVTSWHGSYLHHLRRSNTALFKMSQQWRAVGNTVFDLSPKPPFQQRKVKHVTACPSDRFLTV